MKVDKHLNYALVEDSRPPMYKCVKYWGKKPHNIWREFIECYSPEGGVVLDPFAGSAVAAFEGLIANRRMIVSDINPMTNFFIEVSTESFDETKFSLAANAIINEVKSDPIYVRHYTKRAGDNLITIYNYIWKDGTVWKINAKDDNENVVNVNVNAEDEQNVKDMEKITIPYWYPTDSFPKTPSINGNFINGIGGNDFSYLWTKRNLYLVAKIFDCIERQDKGIQKALLYAFIHMVHLVSKMVVARQEKGNRAFSGSWGRADYMIRNRRMEQNPVIVFERACFDKQGVCKALHDANTRLPHNITKNRMTIGSRYKKSLMLNYGAIDICDLLDYIPEKSVDFIITDPPYGGLVQYMDLSMVWLVWLQHHDAHYSPNPSAEITVKRGLVSRDLYKRRLTNAFITLFRVLKDDGYMVVTFHSKEMQEWNDFVNAVRNAGFVFDKVTHQYNKRSGESNVSNPYGTAGADFYIRCVKKREIDFSNDKSALENFILNKTIEVIARRAEPTPYDFICNGVMPELLQACYLQPGDQAKEIDKVLLKYVGADKVFTIKKAKDYAGDVWWFNNPSEHISFPDIPLSDRVEEAIIAILRRRGAVKLDDIIATLFRMYPNGLTPDPHKIRDVIEKYAFQSAGKWKMKDSVEQEITKHSDMINKLCHIGKRMGKKTFIGKREQPELASAGRLLRDVADISDLSFLKGKYDDVQLERLSMIDCIFFESDRISAIFEVENSTNFTNAVIRASNAEKGIPKYMVIPDERKSELMKFKDPLFVNSFNDNSWKYITYSDIERLATIRTPDDSCIDNQACKL